MLLNCLYVLIAVGILWKCADWFVEGAVGVAEKLQLPHMLVGMVLVSIATTSPELMVSLMAAIQGMPEAALGNAVGSVIVDASVALGLAALVSTVPLAANPAIFKTSARVLICALVLAFIMTLDGTMSRTEGAILVALYIAYATISYLQARKHRAEAKEAEEELVAIEEHLSGMSTTKMIGLFAAGGAGVLLGSHILLLGAEGIATQLGMSNVMMGLTITAIGTSTPEIATCVISARKGKSGIGIGNIIGADILNICWVAGLSSVANPLTAAMSDIYFMFPAAFIIVFAMLGMLRHKYQLTRLNGAILLALATIYFILCLFVLPASGGAGANV